MKLLTTNVYHTETMYKQQFCFKVKKKNTLLFRTFSYYLVNTYFTMKFNYFTWLFHHISFILIFCFSIAIIDKLQWGKHTVLWQKQPSRYFLQNYFQLYQEYIILSFIEIFHYFVFNFSKTTAWECYMWERIIILVIKLFNY